MRIAPLLLLVCIFINACSSLKQQDKAPKIDNSLNPSEIPVNYTGTERSVSSTQELLAATKTVTPGTTIILQNGTYKDAGIVLKSSGTSEQPIIIKAANPGSVFLTGNSFVKIGGDYVTIDGLYFKDGYSQEDAVIMFRASKTHIANHSRVTQTVIEDFTQPERSTKDHWVEFYGKNNELDHCYIAGKSNRGPTLRVFLEGNEHINNYHNIHHNHFGPRPRKGGPQGETMQLGDSYTSMTPSYTQVHHNYFNKCNGEVEIISSKSNFNNFSHNVFHESEGSLVMRHGNYATIDGNLFIGNDRSEQIGGIRVINTGHFITNNYFYKITGTEFRSALAVMNGIPKSPLNRYNQVTDVVVAHNSFVECEQPWQFSVGTNIDQSEVLPESEIRSARPERMVVANNLIYNSSTAPAPVVAYDKVDGVTFAGNTITTTVQNVDDFYKFAFAKADSFKSQNLFKIPTVTTSNLYAGYGFNDMKTDFTDAQRTATNNAAGALTTGATVNEKMLDKSQYGPAWFSTASESYNPKTVTVKAAVDLHTAIAKAQSGDIIALDAGVYVINEQLIINKELHLTSSNKSKPATINITGNALFRMHAGGILHINNLIFKGTPSTDFAATLDKNMKSAYGLSLDKVTVTGFKSILDAAKDSFADEITITDSTFKDCTTGILLNKENDDKGEYSAEFLTIKNSTFDGVKSEVINYYRGGYDESTIGGNFILTGNTFTNCGKEDPSKLLIKNRGIVNVTFANNTFTNNPVKIIAILWGAKKQQPVNNTIQNSGKIEVVDNLQLKLVY
ncbi:MAG: hypothetical protein NWQ19_09440, partial [Nonlabens sp.]|nr:hypothetical protein [Nonlabens sp.]